MTKSAKEKSQRSNSRNSSVKKTSNNIENILSKISKEDLQNFLKVQFSRDRNLKNIFIANFSDLLDEHPAEKYKTIVDSLYKAAQNRNGWVDYQNARTLGKALASLSHKAFECFQKNKILESIVICKTLIENIAGFLNNVDDNTGLLRTALDNSFDILENVAEGCPPMMKDELFEYCIVEIKKEKYVKFEIDEAFLELLPELITTEDQEEKFIKVIDEKIISEESREYGEYSIVRLLAFKVNYYNGKNMQAEADKIIRGNIKYSEFREILVNKYIDNRDFIKAKELCLEGIEISVKNMHPGTTNDWKRILLQIAQLENSVKEIRKLSEELFFIHYDFEYYRILKASFPETDEWKNKCEEILNIIQNERGYNFFGNPDPEAKIFIEEKYYDRLLSLFKKNQGHIYFVDKFADSICEIYPEELISFYSAAIKEHAKRTDRRVYIEVADYLKKLSSLKGSENELRKLLYYFRGFYRKRKAMMEILDENFPQKEIL